MFFHKIIATGLGIGYIGKGAGTIAAIATCICWWLFQTDYTNPYLWPLLVAILLLVIGVMSADKVEEVWGKDNQRVVIDEVAGMWITLLCTPLRWDYIVIGFIFFRFFDILKPFYIRHMEELPGGWGVMADDVLAGIYSNILLQLIIAFKLL
ncbi:phosphatidylglycerophosphatase A family protein [Pedobacter rhodius]|uniref:Phosphatidylglycerophosphatase A n=1 Tax=Pedobacter rhodius TaxID=3004098 RepID=A0ABT4KVI2_9SPHI|nr:phosphatidylglycerophosphatase A [Pedobacter sp. SJ11]MCZ4222937.1 phosphatidylglycerophosphatase A [Pedobacter sp. SJ11]